MKLIDIFNSINESNITLFHGTDKSKAIEIKKSGFKFDVPGISNDGDHVIYLSNRKGATWFAKNNTRNRIPYILEVHVDGNFFNTNKSTSAYGAFAIVCDEFKIPFVGNPKNREVDLEKIKKVLISNNYVGVTFKDKYANNIPVWAVFDVEKIDII